MNRLRETEGIPDLSRWFLAAAFASTGRREVADILIDMRNLSVVPEFQDYYYGSEIRDKAVILYTLTLLNKNEEALPILKEICDKLSTDSWYSTQSVAWGLFSYMKWAEKMSSGSNTPASLNTIINGEKSVQTIQPGKIWSGDIKIKQGDNSLTVENKSGNPVYATLTIKGIPLLSDQVKSEKGMTMKVDYVTTDLRPVDPQKLEQGSDFMMVVKVTNTSFSKVDNIALTCMVPSGWEIQNTRLFETVTGIKEGSFDYRDFRDDRVNTYFSLQRGETKSFVIVLNAAYKGEYSQPSIWCEAMYNAGYYSRQPGNTVTVAGDNIE
jgi:uncharacterized protein YfaS (alpha-2-macroglobulin family)